MPANNIPESIHNHDVVGLYDKIQRFMRELLKSQSVQVSGMIAADRQRLRTYIESLRARHAFIQAQPELDLPETHPRPYPLDPPVMLPDNGVENDAIATLLRLLEALRYELVHSQSALMGCRLQPFDSNRFVAIVDKIEAFLEDYIEVVTPLDMPESSPREERITRGNLNNVG